MNRQYYDTAILHLMSDTSAYRLLEKDHKSPVQRATPDFIKKSSIPENEMKSLTPRDSKVPRL